MGRPLLLIAGIVLSVACYVLLGHLPPGQRVMAAIFLLTVFYWITEPIPLYVTGVIAAFASSLLLGPLAPLTGATPIPYDAFMSPFASPVVVLMFGGFVMARIFSMNNLDIQFCQVILARLGSRPNVVLFGMMAITASMSMWMSNTATTAIMVATVLPIVRNMPPESKLSRALMLAIPFSANVGGIATPIGTPPNAIAIGLLAERGVHVSFLAWMIAGLPIMILMLVATYFLLRLFFPTRRQEFIIEIKEEPATANRTIVYVTFFATVLLWVTDWLHGIPAALVATVPVIVFSAAGLLRKQQLRDIAWDILFLIGGGLALGVGIRQTGLAETLVSTVIPAGMSPFLAQLLLCGVIAFLATLMSNTAASNIILPLAISVAAAFPAKMAIPVALCASYGMALPVSTPPNAIAYGSEMIQGKDMFRVGILVTVVGVVLTLLYEGVLFRVVPALFG